MDAIHAGYSALNRAASDLAQDVPKTEDTSTRPEFVRKLTRADVLGTVPIGPTRGMHPGSSPITPWQSRALQPV